jgi:superfamily II DNA/RNA helicase
LNRRLLTTPDIDISVLALHGKKKQQKRTNTFFEFINAQQGTLICTDVAARGLDIPAVDWIIQFGTCLLSLACPTSNTE